MRLLDRYRRFDDVPREEADRALRAERRRERGLARRPPSVLDLTRTISARLPDTEVVNAALAVTRTGLNAEPDPEATDVRRAAADHHGVAAEQVAVGNGAGELLKAATRALLEPGDELIALSPSYPLYPALARHAGAELVPVPIGGGAVDVDGLLAAVTPRTRVVVLCNPNDPTGSFLPADQLARLLEGLPERVFVLLDEALAHYQSVEPVDAAVALLERFSRLLVFRSFSKVYGLSGLRGGYALGSGTGRELLDALAPALGVNAVTQTAMASALRRSSDEVERRRRSVIGERRRLLEGLEQALGIQVQPSEANFVWVRAPQAGAGELVERLEQERILVASGELFGDREHVRVSVKDGEATDRLLSALSKTTIETEGHT